MHLLLLSLEHQDATVRVDVQHVSVCMGAAAVSASELHSSAVQRLVLLTNTSRVLLSYQL